MSAVPSRGLSLALVCLSVGIAAHPAAAQAGYLPPNPISPPTVSAPTMEPMPTVAAPTVSAPTLSPSSAGQATAASGTKAATAAKASASTATGAKATTTAGASATSAAALSLLGLGSDSALLGALSGTDSDSAGLDALSSLLGTSSSSTDSATLGKILNLLEKQQAQSTASASAAPAVSTSTGTSASAQANEKAGIVSGGEILRLAVNGYNLFPTVTTVVSSILAKDGSFLITGDRAYLSSGRTFAETFYLLCRKNADGSYRLFADVSQNAPNEYSYLWQLARKTPIKGTLTGDLLVFRSTEKAWSCDLVIRIINPTVAGTSVR